MLMQSRVQQIARLISQCENYSINETASPGATASSSIGASRYTPITGTLDALKYIYKMYKDEVKQFNSVSHLEFTMLADIMITIHQILTLRDLPGLIR